MSSSLNKDEIVWERLNKAKKWIPYSAEVCEFMEKAYGKNLTSVCLGDVDPNMKVYDVNVKDFIQTSQSTGTKCSVRRRILRRASNMPSLAIWEWCGDSKKSWHCYSPDITAVLENSYLMGEDIMDLSSLFHGYNYTVDIKKMIQINNYTRYHRPIRRVDNFGLQFPSCSGFSDVDPGQCAAAYSNGMENSVPEEPVNTKALKNKKSSTISKKVNQLWKKMSVGNINDSEDEDETCNESVNKKLCSPDEGSSGMLVASAGLSKEEKIATSYMNSFATAGQSAESIVYALVNGKPWKHVWPPHTPQSGIKPVPGIDPLHTQSDNVKRHRKKKGSNSNKSDTEPVDDLNVFVQFTEEITAMSEGEQCNICYDDLKNGSSYDGDTSLLRLKLCAHVFHKSCLNAMYECGNKDNHLRCPTCKTIHGVKCGTQPPGTMRYHVLPYSLPGYSDRDTIQIIYDIDRGIQGPEHPNPGRRYSARGFPRMCYLPDNEIGRKVLRLLIKAWERRLIFTVGTSSTTGETDTVTWNEIHHKTEFGFNRNGHGYPDPSYFENVIAELAAHGVADATPPRTPTTDL